MKQTIEAIFKEARTQGAVYGVCDAQGNWQYQNIYQDPSSTSKVDLDTRFGIASITKHLTAIGVLACVEQGMLSLDTPVSTYFPQLQDSTMNVRALLSHTSGMYPMTRQLMSDVATSCGIDLNVVDGATHQPLADVGIQRVIAQINAHPERHSVPGTQVSYSNDGFGLLGEIGRIATGAQTYAEFMDTMVFKPFGLTQTTLSFVSDNTSSKVYRIQEDVLVETDTYDTAFCLNGGGAVKSTLHDLSVVGRAILQHQNHVLKHPERMWEVPIAYAPSQAYGYGTEVLHHRYVGHGGSLPGVSSYLMVDLDKGLCAIVLADTQGVPVKDIVMEMLEITTPQRLDIVPWTSKAHLGQYHSDETTDLEIKEDALILNGEHYTYETHADYILSIIVRKRPVYLTLILKDQQVVGVRYGLRIIKKRA